MNGFDVSKFARLVERAKMDSSRLAGSMVMLRIGESLWDAFSDSVREGAIPSKKQEMKALLAILDGSVVAQRRAGVPVGEVRVACSLAMALQVIGAAVAGADMLKTKTEVWPSVARTLDQISEKIAINAPMTAETLSRFAEQLRTELGIGDCGCEISAAWAVVESVEVELDAVDGPTLSEWIDVMSRYRAAVDRVRALYEAAKNRIAEHVVRDTRANATNVN